MLRIAVLFPVLAMLALAVGAASVASPSPSAASPSSWPSPGMAAENPLVPRVDSLTLRNQLGFTFPPGPAVPDGPADEALVAILDDMFGNLQRGVDPDAIGLIADAGDARAAWLLADLLRFVGLGDLRDAATAGFEQLTGVDLDADPIAARSVWQSVSDHLFAWELPALPGYERWKRQLFTLVEPRWEPFFADSENDIDWRFVSWGGVLMDDRQFGDPNPCPRGCIPALDDPAVTDAVGGAWYPDDRLVFGVTVNGDSRAYPKNIMEIHEMVNDELGGRRLGIPYCTLCGSAQAYLTDNLGEDFAMPVLRTSGLLNRSNKMMFDLDTFSVFDTFLGSALSGPLREAGVELEQVSVVTSTWGDWKLAHPDTSIVAEDGGVGRSYVLDPLRGRDDNGPIFPIGDVDERLPAQELVLGVITDAGQPVAFPVAEARAELDAGRPVVALGVEVVTDASGIRAIRADGTEVAGHQAFWFAWSQFHPDTAVWARP